MANRTLHNWAKSLGLEQRCRFHWSVWFVVVANAGQWIRQLFEILIHTVHAMCKYSDPNLRHGLRGWLTDRRWRECDSPIDLDPISTIPIDCSVDRYKLVSLLRRGVRYNVADWFRPRTVVVAVAVVDRAWTIHVRIRSESWCRRHNSFWLCNGIRLRLLSGCCWIEGSHRWDRPNVRVRRSVVPKSIELVRFPMIGTELRMNFLHRLRCMVDSMWLPAGEDRLLVKIILICYARTRE